jgi:hypothetical protein
MSETLRESKLPARIIGNVAPDGHFSTLICVCDIER